ncbi:secreted protein [Beggiatoa sp. PS]|nr:secreted protein [Beggiatoa sp. PS]
MKQILISFVVAMLLLSGCVTSTPIPTSQRSIQSFRNTANIHFNNTGVFDTDLKEAMSTRVKTIIVTVVGDISMNKMPERLEKWLSAVRYKGGKVEFIPEPKPKSPIFSLIAEIREFVNWLNEASWYEFAENYEALVFYEPREPKDGKIKRLEFRRK